jgi:glycosyltransferase involved in cell wall biosynthesis
MRFSIITVAYNQAAYVRSAIESVLSQNYPDLEYIVVDPGSTDGTREIIEEYRDRITRIVYRPDRGAAEGLNNGFAEVSGEVFGFLNSDDILLPGALEKVARVFAEKPHIDLVMGHIWIIDANGKRLRKAYTDRFGLNAFAYGACTICQQATFFRPQAFHDAGGFNVAQRVAWDGELFVNMLKNTSGHMILDELLGAFRIHDSSITGSRRGHAMYQDAMKEQFARLKGRPWRRRDTLLQYLYLIPKYLLEPRSLWQRLRYGSIMKRSRGRKA